MARLNSILVVNIITPKTPVLRFKLFGQHPAIKKVKKEYRRVCCIVVVGGANEVIVEGDAGDVFAFVFGVHPGGAAAARHQPGQPLGRLLVRRRRQQLPHLDDAQHRRFPRIAHICTLDNATKHTARRRSGGKTTREIKTPLHFSTTHALGRILFL